jgi:polyisoprenoid-binding protein YceI
MIDPKRSSVEVSIRHLGVATVRGTFEGLEGQVELRGDGSLQAQASVAPGTIATGDTQRDGFLASPGFFDAGAHPRATFSAAGGRANGDRWTIPGTLTLAGATAPMELKVHARGDEPTPSLAVEGEVDRHAFGLRFPQAAGAGDAVVSKKARIKATVVLVPG